MLGFVALSIVLFPVVGVDLIDLLLGQTMLLSQVLLHGAVHHAELLRQRPLMSSTVIRMAGA